MTHRQRLALLATGLAGIGVGTLGFTSAFAVSGSPASPPVVMAAPTATPEAAVPEQPAAQEATTEATDPAVAPGAVATATTEAPGGHEDPPGQNVDHQFDGQE